MSLPMSVTIKDIAREAGVSYASVSVRSAAAAA